MTEVPELGTTDECFKLQEKHGISDQTLHVLFNFLNEREDCDTWTIKYKTQEYLCEYLQLKFLNPIIFV